MFDKVAVVGGRDLVFAFRVMGLKVFSPKNLEEAKKVIEIIKEKDFALCLLHESLFEPLSDELKTLKDKFCPVVVGFSDYRKVTDYLEKVVRQLAIKATGSDVLKRRGEDERR
jgi:vacuolar-type H+-ATPase subunit F/Vma7